MTLFEERKPLTHAAVKKTFSDRVVELALSIPRGRVSTYGAIARAAGGGGMAAQSITGILGKAWENGQKKIPFHRIVYSDGRIWVSERYKKIKRGSGCYAAALSAIRPHSPSSGEAFPFDTNQCTANAFLLACPNKRARRTGIVPAGFRDGR